MTGTDKIYFTSDTHSGHRKIIELDNAPFSTIEERDAFICEENRKVLVPGTTLYHLGDVAWYNRSLPPYLDSIKGKVILIRGNHDDKVAWDSDGFAEKHESVYLEIATCNTGLTITNDDGTPVKTIKLHLSHYPIVAGEWRNQKHGSFHLFGHVHGSRDAVTEGRAMDVGVHPNEYKPVPLSTVLRKLWDKWAEPII